MSSSKTKLERWEHRLKKVFDEIDSELEAEGACKKFKRHPNRPPAGATSNREDDGLFDLGAAFTVGIGSQHGPGYVVQARIATLDDVPAATQHKFEAEVARRLRQKLPAAFPGIQLHIDRDGPVYKIHGDLSLGTL
ncbi:MAG TPA: hypothetical protein DCM68_02955 [Verrucomicrobia bacterium]|nr:hypothetical protein [Verrucomicrobiota bacterium]